MSMNALKPPAQSAPRPPVVSFGLLFLTGVGMALPGLYLAALGGSLYYAVAGGLTCFQRGWCCAGNDSASRFSGSSFWERWSGQFGKSALTVGL